MDSHTLTNIALLALAMIVLLVCEWLGYRRWIRPHAARLTLQGKLLLLLVILTLAGGFIGPFSWWFSVPDSFAWAPPPLAGRMLATAGWCFALIAFVTLQRPTQRRVRLFLIALAIYMAPLVVAILLFHLDRLDFAAPITYPFLAVVTLLTVGPIGFLIRQPHILDDEAADLAPSPPLLRGWLGLVTLVTGLWGLALFVTDSGPLDAVWVWPGDALSSRLIAVMLLTIAAGGLYGLRHADTARIVNTVAMLYGLGLAIASLWNALADKPVKLSYVIVFGVIFVGSLVVDRLSRHPAARLRPA